MSFLMIVVFQMNFTAHGLLMAVPAKSFVNHPKEPESLFPPQDNKKYTKLIATFYLRIVSAETWEIKGEDCEI